MPADRPSMDPRLRLLRNARREAAIVLGVWAAFLVWVVGYSFLRGYAWAPDQPPVPPGIATPRGAADFTCVMGLPDWVFFGIALPWLAATAFTILFGARILADDDLGEERDLPAAGEKS